MILTESRIQPFIRHDTNPTQVIELYGSIFMKGLSLISRAAYLSKSTLIIHSALQIPLNSSNLSDITILIETMKAMGLNLHHLATWWDVLEVCRERPYFSDSALSAVRKFLEDPVAWSKANGGIGSAAEARKED